ncbi:MAG TPA: helix-turn-helix domain-containing protein [Prolixibacteraceae bacterium]|nr:helix-turn-helix domain-containing protein [Prolixibacteraceae bacterium]
METILLFGILEALLIAGLILSKKKKTAPDFILFAFFIFNVVVTLLSFLEIYNRSHNYPYPAFLLLSSPIILLHPPILWLYVKSLTDQHFSFKPVYLLHLLPFLLMLAEFSFNFYFLSTSQKVEIIQTESFKEKWDYPFFILLMAVQSAVYFGWAVKLIKQYNRQIEMYFSETHRIDLSWLRILMSSSAAIYTLIYLTFLADLITPILTFESMHSGTFALTSIYIIVLGFFGHRQRGLFASELISFNLENAKEIKFNEHLADSSESVFIQQLLTHMKTRKSYLNAEITIAILSAEMDVTPEYLSGILNGRLNKNFFDFINHFRIEEFKTQCADPRNKQLTLIGIAYNCGFNSKPTFNRVFKKTTQMTPGEYFSQVSKK